MSFLQYEIEEAYSKLRSYIYHDNTDLFLRQQLVEFETNITKGRLNFNTNGKLEIGEKLEILTKKLNNFNNNREYFDLLIEQISINYYPKKVSSTAVETNFITNKKSKEKYSVDKVTPFINAPIELHIISVLWIMDQGVKLDAELGDECFGNRLILNKEKDRLVQGSGLFKPYFNQYQRWRDSALHQAKQLLDDGRDVAFVNLDIKEYFNSVRLPVTDLYDKERKFSDRVRTNLKKVFLSIHQKYTAVFSKYQNLEGIDEEEYVILPIGLVSSYILANYYLFSFDKSINRHIKPIYYGRYVDDLLFVVADPVHPDEIEEDEFTVNRSNDEFTLLEKFITENFSPVLSIDIDEYGSQKRKIQLKGDNYKSLHCQSSKSLIYLFDADESHLVIDKLKEELNDRTSEFRDFPDEEESMGNFTEAAYQLQYEDSKEKVRSLKDYKEDRFGLTLYLANKIFSSLRQEEELSNEACESILKFFKNKTAIEFYRLWERIFTLFLVNNKPTFYVKFYLQCIKEIDKLKTDKKFEHVNEKLKHCLSEYLDIANEITFSLNLSFYESAKEAAREFDFTTEEFKGSIFFSIDDYLPTKADVYWRKRFRKSNMMRHHYIIHPLLNYTVASLKGSLKNLVKPHLDFTKYVLDPDLIRNSPRRVKFWECNMAQIFVDLQLEKNTQQENKTSIFTLNKNTEIQTSSNYEDEYVHLAGDDDETLDCLLTKAYDIFKEVNERHIPKYELGKGGKASRENIFNITSITKSNSPTVWLNEIKVGDTSKQDKFKIAFANTHVKEANILQGIRGKANLSSDRVQRLGNVIRSARTENADILLLPEFFIPIDLLSSIVDYARKNEKMVVSGLEHIAIGKYAYNFIVTVIPTNIGGVKDAIIIPRLKNHYAHIEQHIIEGNHKIVPKPDVYRYDLFIWKNLYFSSYYCFELANIHHRGLWKNKIDLMIGVEWNKDVPYYSNIVEATSRDLHCFFAQVNTSQYGDSRLTQPVESALKDILRLKGGDNDALLTASLRTDTLREFQRQAFSLTHQKREFKPLPPDYDPELVIKRINNDSVING
jgi:hypothetical protein